MLTIIGDVHQKYPEYIAIAKEKEYTLQLGDMGFNYLRLKELDATKHKFFPGNHDNYDIVSASENNIGDYGLKYLGGVNFYFVRGAWSIDWRMRTPHVSWWNKEELSFEEMNAVRADYAMAKPNIMITHDCPLFICRHLKHANIGMPGIGVIKNRTNILLEDLFDIHAPQKWIFGHWHSDFQIKLFGCHFICLKELGTLDIYGETSK